MGHRSKFTFPMPGRSAKKTPAAAVSNPLSKAERILGTGGQKLGSPTGTRDPGRLWETESAGGISISISESSASQSGVLDEEEDGYDRSNYGRALWEDESEALPRRLRGTNGLFSKGLKPKTSAVTLGSRSRDTLTDDTSAHRPQTSSTINSYYESDKMPLSISQQTSNSAMAKGLPTKAHALLDIDGALYGKGQQPKKKPSKLDFSKLRLRTRKEHHADSNGVGPVLGNNYVMKSPSVMSHTSHSVVSLARSPPSPGGSELTPRPAPINQSQPPEVSTRTGRSKVVSNASTLHQLYDHYEQMSFRHAGALKEEDEEEEEEVGDKGQLHQERLLPRTYEPTVSDMSREDMVTPLPHSSLRDPNSRWNHSRNTSQASKVTAMRAETPSTIQIRPSSRNEYAASVSSRHTRTSKATPSIMSTMDSDRQQQSVLSLTDSESDEEETSYSGPGSSLRSYDNSFRDDSSIASSQRQRSTSRLSISSHSTNHKGASYAQLNDYLTIPHASPKTKSTRSPSTNTLHSTNSSLSTATRVSLPIHHQDPQPQSQPQPQPQDARGSVSTVNTLGSILSPTYSTHTHYSVQEARAIAFIPYVSTAEAASSVSVDQIPISLNHALSRQGRQCGSQNSHTSDQPTPPLSPTSVEFYKKSPESSRRESTVGKASESQNGRMMAVTKQEEMLLAALRKKRARMRENIIAELEEGRSSPGGASLESVEDIEQLASAHLKDAERQATKEVREARARAKQANNVPIRSSSLAGRAGRSSSSGHGRVRNHSNGPRRMEASPSASYREPVDRAPSRIRASPGPESRPTGKSRHERVLLYLDRPIDSIDVIDEAEPSPDLSEFMEEDLEFPPGEHRSRIRSKRGSSPYGSPHHGRPRPDSSPMSPRDIPIKNLPRGSPSINEDIDADDIDFDDFPMVGGRPKLSTLKSVPEKGVPRPDSLVSPADGSLPSSTLSHKKGKKSTVRLSAVGQINSPVPWWGDDD
ncbi:hypothetical protein F4813DRAFT_275335 [Daldinia decipiens]|uniref:uncharacterized protein n=1 Tax=Daldinia decipiens TaxID=326647 RepID=UPI0020C591C4|nr:uncharacterized protein F4813DRAFT_275335 [Daldinia decipiens]KAI1653286.1 hypothetical protein F4813DRAFT_275335 [Daldinia decipiens]